MTRQEIDQLIRKRLLELPEPYASKAIACNLLHGNGVPDYLLHNLEKALQGDCPPSRVLSFAFPWRLDPNEKWVDVYWDLEKGEKKKEKALAE